MSKVSAVKKLANMLGGCGGMASPTIRKQEVSQVKPPQPVFNKKAKFPISVKMESTPDLSNRADIMGLLGALAPHLLTTGGGAALGAINAPEGHSLRGAGRGAIQGLGAGVGATVGTGLGGAVGGAAGEYMGGVGGRLAGTATGTLGGGAAGALGGYELGKKLTGEAPWDREKRERQEQMMQLAKTTAGQGG